MQMEILTLSDLSQALRSASGRELLYHRPTGSFWTNNQKTIKGRVHALRRNCWYCRSYTKQSPPVNVVRACVNTAAASARRGARLIEMRSIGHGPFRGLAILRPGFM